MIQCVICLVLSIFYLQIKAQTVIPLYDQAIPNSKMVVDEEYSRIEPGNILIVYKVKTQPDNFPGAQRKGNRCRSYYLPGRRLFKSGNGI